MKPPTRSISPEPVSSSPLPSKGTHPMNAPTRLREHGAGEFERRHIGPSPRDIDAMLKTVGVRSMDELIAQTIPQEIRQRAPLDMEPALSETEALARLRALAQRNQVFTSLI